MKRELVVRFLVLSSVLLFLGASAALAERLIVKTAGSSAAVRQQIATLGGSVAYAFKNANALVVNVPDDKVAAVRALAGVESAVHDGDVPNPRPREVLDLNDEAAAGAAPALPANYFPYGSELTGAAALQQAGVLGQGVVVGIIDSGVSTGAVAVASRIVGGENFVPGASEPGANSPLNDPHGTWVACMIGANAAFGFAHNSTFATAVRTYCTPAASSPCTFDAGGGIDGIPMVGQAPAAQFYALKVFPAAGGGAPESRILQAMDRAIELKNTTQPSMKVVNMSLGGTTFFAAHDVEDELASSMAQAGITLVVSSGNTGPSGSTVGSPGTAKNILTVGAASSAVHERILRDLQFGAGIGPLYRPDDGQQMAYFSSRGPDADGRVDPEVVANGLASFVQGADGGISLASGTSFSAPTVSGVAALLYSAKPSSTPARIRTALLLSANSHTIPTARREDQGFGYVDAAGARALLDRFLLPIPDLGLASKSVALNVLLAGVIPIGTSHFSTHLANLKPAERRDFYFAVDKSTATVRVTLHGITPALPPAEQNGLFGDDVLFAVHSAKTSQIGASGDYLAFDFVGADRTFELSNLDAGLLRVTVNGDWTNAGAISTDLTIDEVHAPLSKRDFRGDVAQGEEDVHTIDIPAGTASATFTLSWDDNWGAYPTDDLDIFVQGPDGAVHAEGATINSPERVTVTNPAAGTWKIFVDGFVVFGSREKYEVRVD